MFNYVFHYSFYGKKYIIEEMKYVEFASEVRNEQICEHQTQFHQRNTSP